MPSYVHQVLFVATETSLSHHEENKKGLLKAIGVHHRNQGQAWSQGSRIEKSVRTQVFLLFSEPLPYDSFSSFPIHMKVYIYPIASKSVLHIQPHSHPKFFRVKTLIGPTCISCPEKDLQYTGWTSNSEIAEE